MPHNDDDLRERARQELACRLIELSELAGGLGELVIAGDAVVPGELILAARRIRLLSQTVPNAAIRAERAAASWGELCIALGLGYEEAEDRYEGDFQDWAAGRVGMYPGLPAHLGRPATRWPDSGPERGAVLRRWLTRRKTAQVNAPAGDAAVSGARGA